MLNLCHRTRSLDYFIKSIFSRRQTRVNLAFLIGMCAISHCAQAKTLKVPSQGYIICVNSKSLKAIANMINVGETNIANILYKRLVLQKKCSQLRVGETITIVDGGVGSDIVRITRGEGRKYYMFSRVLQFDPN